jgi:diguanylate cyclase (GGDEF)-like protein
MAQAQAAVPLIVLTGREDDVELVNRSLREGGHAVRCHWVAKIDALLGALDDHDPQLICFFPDSLPAPIREIAKIKQQAARMVPLVVVSKAAEETDIADALLAGAQDLVSLGQTERLRSVAERELRAFRLERALNETLQSANQYKLQLKAFMAGSVDAIAHVQEGILVDANQAWVEVFGHTEADSVLGTPLMDSFDTTSQAALKGALVACAKGQWNSETLKVAALTANGATLPLNLMLEATSFDGEKAVKLSVPRGVASTAPEPEDLVDQAVNKDATTGFYHRRRFLEVLTDRLDNKSHGGVRALAYIRPDKFREVEDQVGPISSEDILVQVAEQLRLLAQPHDLYGRFGGQVFTMFLERGTLRDVEAWAQNVCARLAARIFEVNHNTLSLTCTIGLAEVGPGTDTMETLIAAAKKTNQTGREQGGNRVSLEQTSDKSTRIQRFDEIWVQQIKSALMENRFRLAHLPIASLGGEQKVMLDTLIRMIDSQGDEVAAADFMPAASRSRMLRAIDRWVIGASLAFCAKQKIDVLFIKLSSESLIDKTLAEWLAKAVESSGVARDKLCFQVREEDATQYLMQTKALADQLLAQGHLFAIEHFGIGHDSARVLASTPMRYLKIDGSLMQTLATDQSLQEKVRAFITQASALGIETIAERVEDANTMAVLFQLGAAYMQGHYVHEPEVVLSEGAGAQPR